MAQTPTQAPPPYSYSKNFYHILNLAPYSPLASTTVTGNATSNSPARPRALDAIELKQRYRAALLVAHPDKHRRGKQGLDGHSDAMGKGGKYTIDDVKQAYATLADAGQRRGYDAWLVRSRRLGPPGCGLVEEDGTGLGVGVGESGGNGGLDADFVLGLEVLDLSDFAERSIPPPGSAGEEGESERIEWTRACRCGDTRGFRIEEAELENAVERGEAEVLVGCAGCSLWVRVGFGVE